MIPAVQPIKQQAYTNQGNEYTESNFGKYAAGASIAGTAALYGGKYAVKGAKKAFEKAKVIKLNIPKIKKPDFKAIKTPKSLKTLIKDIPAKFASAMSALKEAVVTGAKFIKSNISKINKSNIKKAANASFDFIKTNAKKINKENLKKVGKTIVEFAKKPAVKSAAGVAAGVAAVVAAGYAIDFVVNKISAHKADKDA